MSKLDHSDRLVLAAIADALALAGRDRAADALYHLVDPRPIRRSDDGKVIELYPDEPNPGV